MGRWAEIHADSTLDTWPRYCCRHVPTYTKHVLSPKTLQEKENACVTGGRVDGWEDGGWATNQRQHQHQHPQSINQSARQPVMPVGQPAQQRQRRVRE